MKVIKIKCSGKDVFVGMDVHKKKYVLVAICERQILKRWTTVANPQGLSEQLSRYFQGAKIQTAYEAGFSGFQLHRELISAGIHNRVVHAASIAVQSHNRVKTDKRDAQKIAQELAAGKLEGIYVPSLEQERRRSLSRAREQAVSRKTTLSNQLKMKLYYLGSAPRDDQRISRKFFRWVGALDLAYEHKFALKELIDAIEQEMQRIKRFDQELSKQAEEDHLEKTYRSIPGIGKTSSRVLSNELGDMSQFGNERQLFCWLGLTPSEHSSGEKVRRGHISRQGSPRIRAILVEVAWRAIRSDTNLRTYYQGLAFRRGGNRAIVAVARKLIGRVRSCLRKNETWKATRIAA